LLIDNSKIVLGLCFQIRKNSIFHFQSICFAFQEQIILYQTAKKIKVKWQVREIEQKKVQVLFSFSPTLSKMDAV
jgi:hypothetical protein